MPRGVGEATDTCLDEMWPRRSDEPVGACQAQLLEPHPRHLGPCRPLSRPTRTQRGSGGKEARRERWAGFATRPVGSTSPLGPAVLDSGLTEEHTQREAVEGRLGQVQGWGLGRGWG